MSNQSTKFSFFARAKSFTFALKGLGYLVRNEHNSWLHIAGTAMVVILGAWLGISRTVWLWLIIAIGGVWSAEAMNTAVECVCDAVSPGYNQMIGHAKDVAAGAVLLSAGTAALIGALVFGPHVIF